MCAGGTMLSDINHILSAFNKLDAEVWPFYVLLSQGLIAMKNYSRAHASGQRSESHLRGPICGLTVSLHFPLLILSSCGSSFSPLMTYEFGPR